MEIHPEDALPELPELVQLPDIVARLHDTTIAPGSRYIRIVRVSKTGGRDTTSEGFIAPHEQRRVTDEHCARHGGTIVGEYEELDVSGGKIDRAALDKALADVLAGKADGIIVAYLSRYARTTAGLQFVRKLQAKGKAFVSVAEGIGPEMLQTSMGWFTFTIMLAVAELQLGILTEGFLAARRAHISAGIANQVPYGYRKRLTGDPAAADPRERPRRLEPDPLTSPHVVYMFERRAAGDSWITIAKALDEMKVPPPGKGKCWLYERVRSIVQNRIYLGELTSGQFVNPSAHFPIITPDQFDAAKALNQSLTRNGKANYQLTGIIHCATCGGKMVGYMQTIKAGKKRTGQPRKYAYYRCRRRYSWGVCSAPAYAAAADLEALVKDEFFRRFLRDLVQTADAPDRSAELAAAQEAVDEALLNEDLFLTSPSTTRSAKLRGRVWYDAEREKLTDAIEVAVANRQKLRNALTGTDFPEGLEEDWDDLTLEEQRGFLSAGFGIVAIKPSGGKRIPVADRLRIWARNEPGSPEGTFRDAKGRLVEAPIKF
jgi:DNA invertase Pin-like site-specific DNA recombinase